jgi:hypothetical protein
MRDIFRFIFCFGHWVILRCRFDPAGSADTAGAALLPSPARILLHRRQRLARPGLPFWPMANARSMKLSAQHAHNIGAALAIGGKLLP